MSRSIDLFIDTEQPVNELAGAIGELLAHRLVEDPATGVWSLTDGEVEARLSEHPYVDDGDLPFTRFKYSLSARVANSVRPQDAPATALLRRTAELVQRQLGLSVLLVMDLQYRDHEVDGAGGGTDGRGPEAPDVRVGTVGPASAGDAP
ncbi:MAG TPA: hypothetical protein VLX59_09395 [Acidimicrobiales bacterium]|nr:hypothetical protein [Acidimicrobiales bacterium]